MNANIDRIWALTLFVIGICTIILAGTNIIGIELPDVIVRIIGVIDLIAIPVLVYATIKKTQKGKK